MDDRYRGTRERLLEGVLRGAATLPPEFRQAAASRGAAGSPAATEWVKKIHDHAYRATDEDVARLKEGGLDDDAIFELTVAAAVGAASLRMDCALRALEADEAAELGAGSGAGEGRRATG
jgi:hypothetical protein